MKRGTKQAPSPKTQSGGGNGDENEQRVRRQVRVFREDTPDMCQSEQAKNRAGGYDIGFHGKYWGGIAFSGRSSSQSILITHQRRPSDQSWMLLIPRPIEPVPSGAEHASYVLNTCAIRP